MQEIDEKMTKLNLFFSYKWYLNMNVMLLLYGLMVITVLTYIFEKLFHPGAFINFVCFMLTFFGVYNMIPLFFYLGFNSLVAVRAYFIHQFLLKRNFRRMKKQSMKNLLNLVAELNYMLHDLAELLQKHLAYTCLGNILGTTAIIVLSVVAYTMNASGWKHLLFFSCILESHTWFCVVVFEVMAYTVSS